jgi:hypothetical protein
MEAAGFDQPARVERMWIAFEAGEPGRVLEHLETLLSLSMAGPAEEAAWNVAAARGYLELGLPQRALELSDRAQQLASGSGTAAEALALATLAAIRTGDVDGARSRWDQLDALARSLGSPRLGSWTAVLRAHLAQAAGDDAAAVDAFRATLDDMTPLIGFEGDHFFSTVSVRYELARQLLEMSTDPSRTGHRQRLAEARTILDDLAQGRRLEGFRPPIFVRRLGLLGRACAALGDDGAARSHYQALLTAWPNLGSGDGGATHVGDTNGLAAEDIALVSEARAYLASAADG